MRLAPGIRCVPERLKFGQLDVGATEPPRSAVVLCARGERDGSLPRTVPTHQHIRLAIAIVDDDSRWFESDRGPKCLAARVPIVGIDGDLGPVKSTQQELDERTHSCSTDTTAAVFFEKHHVDTAPPLTDEVVLNPTRRRLADLNDEALDCWSTSADILGRHFVLREGRAAPVPHDIGPGEPPNEQIEVGLGRRAQYNVYAFDHRMRRGAAGCRHARILPDRRGTGERRATSGSGAPRWPPRRARRPSSGAG